MLYLSEEDVAGLLTVREAIPEVERALRSLGAGTAVNNPRRRLRLRGALLVSLEAGDGTTRFIGHKNYLAVPGKGVLSHFFLYDAESRALVAMMQANELGRIRTGATTGVAAKYLARPDSSRHAVFGAGFQAETQVLAVNHVLPIREVRVWSRTPERAGDFCHRLQSRLPGVSVEPATDDPAALANWGDVVTVATRATEPVLHGSWLRPGTFVSAIGSNSLARREVDVETVLRADLIVVDSLPGAELEAGDLLPALEQGGLLWSEVRPLDQVVARILPGRTGDEQIILFESQGMGIEDLAVGHFAYAKAVSEGAGRQLDIV